MKYHIGHGVLFVIAEIIHSALEEVLHLERLTGIDEACYDIVAVKASETEVHHCSYYAEDKNCNTLVLEVDWGGVDEIEKN